jgi:hypothetical protein
MPTYKRFGTDDREGVQDRWKPAIDLDKKPAIVVREPGAATHPTAQNNQLISQCRVLCLEPQLRFEQRPRKGQEKSYQSNHNALTLGDSSSQSMRMRFSVRSGHLPSWTDFITTTPELKFSVHTGPGMDEQDPPRMALHRARQTATERVRRKLQRPVPRRVPERRSLRLAR